MSIEPVSSTLITFPDMQVTAASQSGHCPMDLPDQQRKRHYSDSDVTRYQRSEIRNKLGSVVRKSHSVIDVSMQVTAVLQSQLFPVDTVDLQGNQHYSSSSSGYSGSRSSSPIYFRKTEVSAGSQLRPSPYPYRHISDSRIELRRYEIRKRIGIFKPKSPTAVSNFI